MGEGGGAWLLSSPFVRFSYYDMDIYMNMNIYFTLVQLGV